MLLLPPSTDDLRARGARAAGPCFERHTVAYSRTESARVFCVIFLYVVACVVSSLLPTALALACSFVAACFYIPALVELELYTRNGRQCSSTGHDGLGAQRD
jgi:hypothetical protein